MWRAARPAPGRTVAQADVGLSAAWPVRVQAARCTGDIRPHDHAYHEIGLVTKGRAVHLLPEGAGDLRPGSLFVMAPGAIHAIEGAGGLEVVNTYFLNEWLLGDLDALWAEPGAVTLFAGRAVLRAAPPHERQIELGDHAAILAELSTLAVEGEQRDPSPLLLRATFLKLVALIARDWRTADPGVAATGLRAEVRAEMGRIDGLVATGAAFEGGGAGPLAAQFARETGQSRRDYFQRRRVQRACRMLLSGRDSLTGIAADVGYADGPHFGRMFRKYRGMTSRAYRRTYLGAQD
jgi:hypothetical protein